MLAEIHRISDINNNVLSSGLGEVNHPYHDVVVVSSKLYSTVVSIAVAAAAAVVVVLAAPAPAPAPEPAPAAGACFVAFQGGGDINLVNVWEFGNWRRVGLRIVAVKIFILFWFSWLIILFNECFNSLNWTYPEKQNPI